MKNARKKEESDTHSLTLIDTTHKLFPFIYLFIKIG